MLNLIRISTLILSLFFSGFAIASTVNVNTADATTMAENLDGVGVAKATAIVKYREKNGAFGSMDDLLKVNGIGEVILDRNKDRISFKAGSKAK
jgi:competence protein ComEA